MSQSINSKNQNLVSLKWRNSRTLLSIWVFITFVAKQYHEIHLLFPNLKIIIEPSIQ